MRTHLVPGTGGELAELGVARMRLLLAQEQTNGALSAGEFRGLAGRWTVPHVHVQLDEYFYVAEGEFRFTCAEVEMVADTGAFLMVPRGTSHVFRALKPGTLLVLWTPGGLEQMFLELGRRGPDAITDPAVRAEISGRYDSKPV